jgi:hypothetical protein
MGLKCIKNLVKYIPDMSLRETRPTTKEDNATSNHVIFAEHHHGPSPREHRRQPDEDGPNQSSPGCTSLAPFGPRLGRLMLTALPNVGMVVSPRFNVLGGRFGTFHIRTKHFLNSFLLSTYKRRLPPHLNNTQRNKSYTTRAPFQRA